MVKNTREVEQHLIAELELRSGRRIRSREDVAAYIEELPRTAAAKTAKRQNVKQALLAALLTFAALQYYFIDVQLQIMSQPTLTVFVPVKAEGGAKVYFGG